MNNICKPEETNIPTVTSVIISPDGRYTLDNVNALISNFQSTIVTLPQETTNLARLISTYGSDAVYQSNETLNRMLVGIAAPILPNYPTINERINTGVPITPVEYAEFITEFLYTPFTIETNSVTDYVRLVSELDDFFTQNFSKSSMGSFCALAPSIFGAIQGFFDILDSFKDIINKIQNFSVAALLNQLKEKIKAVIDKTIEKVKNIIENFSLQNIMGRVETFVNENIVGKAMELRDEALRFFSEENIKNLKDKIEGLINYAISLFKDPSLEEIQYLIYRFCNFISQVENAINSIRNPLDTFTSNYQSALSVISGRSNGNTASAVSAGAIRYTQDQRRAGVAGARSAETAAGNPPPIEAAEIEGVTPWNNARGDGRIGFAGGWLQPPDPNSKDCRRRNSPGEEGWTRVVPEVRIRIMRVQARFGRRLIINSGYRPPAYNACLSGAATNSQHLQGNALDVTWSGINEQTRQEFINIALEEGFRGIGIYRRSNFVHVDIGPSRRWTGN